MKKSWLVLLFMTLSLFAWADDGDDGDDDSDGGDNSSSAPPALTQESLKLGNKNISGGDSLAQFPREDDSDN